MELQHTVRYGLAWDKANEVTRGDHSVVRASHCLDLDTPALSHLHTPSPSHFDPVRHAVFT